MSAMAVAHGCVQGLLSELMEDQIPPDLQLRAPLPLPEQAIPVHGHLPWSRGREAGVEISGCNPISQSPQCLRGDLNLVFGSTKMPEKSPVCLSLMTAAFIPKFLYFKLKKYLFLRKGLTM